MIISWFENCINCKGYLALAGHYRILPNSREFYNPTPFLFSFISIYFLPLSFPRFLSSIISLIFLYLISFSFVFHRFLSLSFPFICKAKTKVKLSLCFN